MKYIVSLSLFIFFAFWSFSFIWNSNIVNANSIFNNTTNEIPYCKWWDCWLNEWIKETKKINNLKTTWTASGYIKNIVVYLLGFVYLIAVLLIIYAGFNLLMWVGDEEKAKKSKTMILYVIIWIVIIFLAWPIVDFVTVALWK
jgi:type IV secretory pathway VirB2 component (pilin)